MTTTVVKGRSRSIRTCPAIGKSPGLRSALVQFKLYNPGRVRFPYRAQRDTGGGPGAIVIDWPARTFSVRMSIRRDAGGDGALVHAFGRTQ